MNLKRCIFRKSHPAGPTRGQDVIVFAHGLAKHPKAQFEKPPQGFDDVFNELKAEATERVQRSEGISATGNIGQETANAIWPYVDAYRRLQYRRFTVPNPPPPPLVEPNQGFHSLRVELWPAFSLGRNMGLSDLGTFNPASTLPSGGKSDHAYYPARAFDLGVEPDTGYANPVGRSFFQTMVGNCGYVILGDRIWSQARASEGVRHYGGGGHSNHVHVSL